MNERYGYTEKNPVRLNCPAYRPAQVSKSSQGISSDVGRSVSFIQDLASAEEIHQHVNHSLEQLAEINSHLLTQFLSTQSILMRRLGSSMNVALKQELDEANANLDLALSEISALKEQNSSVNLQMSTMQTQHFLALSKAKEKEKTALIAGREEGIALCRDKIFHTSPGQHLLKDLHQGLLEAYKLSKSYMVDMGPSLSHFTQIGFTTAQEQAQAQGFSGSYDPKAMFKKFFNPHFKGDPNQPMDFPWWSAVMKEAISKFLSSEDFSSCLSPSSEIFYQIPSGSTSELAVDESLSTLPSTLQTDTSLEGDANLLKVQQGQGSFVRED